MVKPCSLYLWCHAGCGFGLRALWSFYRCQLYLSCSCTWLKCLYALCKAQIVWIQRLKTVIEVDSRNKSFYQGLTGLELLNLAGPKAFYSLVPRRCLRVFEQKTKTTSLSSFSPNGEVGPRQPDECIIDFIHCLSVLLHITHLALLAHKALFFFLELDQDHHQCKWHISLINALN